MPPRVNSITEGQQKLSADLFMFLFTHGLVNKCVSNTVQVHCSVVHTSWDLKLEESLAGHYLQHISQCKMRKWINLLRFIKISDRYQYYFFYPRNNWILDSNRQYSEDKGNPVKFCTRYGCQTDSSTHIQSGLEVNRNPHNIWFNHVDVFTKCPTGLNFDINPHYIGIVKPVSRSVIARWTYY